MSFPNPDNYARDCDCGTAGANTTPPPATIQGEIDSLDTRVTVLEETNDVIVSSGGIANLTTAQQALIREGSIVVTTDGKRWIYSGSGSKVLEASYIELSDLTIGSTANLPLITGASGVITAGTFGTTANSFCQGNDVRLSDARTPTPHTHGNITNVGAVGSTANLPLITTTSGVITTGTFGTTANSFCQGNDVRLGSQTIFTLGGEAKTTFVLGTSYLYGCMPTRGPQLSGSYLNAVLQILGNFTITGIAIHQYLPSAATATLTYQLVRVTDAFTVVPLGSSIVVTGNNNLTTSASSLSASLTSGDLIGLMLTLGATGTVPSNLNATTVLANLYCVPR